MLSIRNLLTCGASSVSVTDSAKEDAGSLVVSFVVRARGKVTLWTTFDVLAQKGGIVARLMTIPAEVDGKEERSHSFEIKGEPCKKLRHKPQLARDAESEPRAKV